MMWFEAPQRAALCFRRGLVALSGLEVRVAGSLHAQMRHFQGITLPFLPLYRSDGPFLRRIRQG